MAQAMRGSLSFAFVRHPDMFRFSFRRSAAECMRGRPAGLSYRGAAERPTYAFPRGAWERGVNANAPRMTMSWGGACPARTTASRGKNIHVHFSVEYLAMGGYIVYITDEGYTHGTYDLDSTPDP
jgi:hypothetical protein